MVGVAMLPKTPPNLTRIWLMEGRARNPQRHPNNKAGLSHANVVGKCSCPCDRFKLPSLRSFLLSTTCFIFLKGPRQRTTHSNSAPPRARPLCPQYPARPPGSDGCRAGRFSILGLLDKQQCGRAHGRPPRLGRRSGRVAERPRNTPHAPGCRPPSPRLGFCLVLTALGTSAASDGTGSGRSVVDYPFLCRSTRGGGADLWHG